MWLSLLKLTLFVVQMCKVYTGHIETLPENGVFVFGCNPVGVNGNIENNTGGAALFASKVGWVEQNEIIDNSLSKSGKAYGITTVKYPGRRRSMSPCEIIYGIKKLYLYALEHPHLDFFVAYTIDRNLNGYSYYEMAEMFATYEIPENIVFNDKFLEIIKQYVNELGNNYF